MSISCPNCGAVLNDTAKFCNKCGTPVGAAAPRPAPRPAPQSFQRPAPRSPAAQPVPSFKKGLLRGDLTAKFSPEDIRRNKGMAVLAYLGPLVLIAIFASKKSRYARFHANQALNLVLGYMAVWGYFKVAAALLNLLFGGLGDALSGILYIAALAVCILGLMGMFHAASGKAKELPIWGKKRVLRP